MSLDGGYIGSIDHAIANLHIGRHQGRQQGIEEGYRQGHQAGYNAGWDAGVAAGNVQILKQMEYTRQHIAEKERIKAELVQQRELIEVLKGANQRLQEQVTELDAKFQERRRQYVDQLWQYNRALIFVNSVREVLEELTSDRSPNADHVRQLFAEKYAHQVSQGLKEGAIKAAPEVDDEFAKALPKTRKFIVDMLSSAGSLKEVS